MLTFWIMFIIPLWAVLTPRKLPLNQARLVWWTVAGVLILVIGLRHEVGGDWFSYLAHFQRSAGISLGEAATLSDPGHYVFNWLVARLGGNIYAVNLTYATILMFGTMHFCRSQPNPWLALLVAVPYMLIVVGMGYTRQSVALGFALLGLVALQDGRARSFVFWVAFAALFHKSAVLLLPIAALAASRNRWLTGALALSATMVMYYLVLDRSAETLWENYVEADMQSSGGPIRVAMNALPALLLLVLRRRLGLNSEARKLWSWMAVFALFCVPLVGISSTAVDRMALYLIPLQLVVFARIPRLATTVRARTPIVLGIVGYYALVQYIWLNFAKNSERWLPYEFMPFT